MSMKFISISRMVTFIVTLLTTIPLFINYLMGSEPTHALIVHLHVWFGLAFFVFAILSMRMQKRTMNKQKG